MSVGPADADMPRLSELTAAERERSRRLTLRYLLASTAILGVSGILGVLIRDSQGDVGKIDSGWWYALMTAHGLGTFVGWAVFALMGLSYWVLAHVGFPLRRFGSLLAELTWWLMVVGVAGVVITCLGFKYGGSWVFLYPISFHSAGQWGKWTSFFFNGSVLLVGLAIVTWCVAILHTVLGPALHAARSGIGNRLGVALGFGFVSPSRFPTNPRPVPYSVIPLTVIAIDMIIATLPLAVLLVEMMIQSLSPGVTVDPLLAKNVLWFFGHPVVYLLLFPAVALYYLLIPRFAGRALVAGNVITIGWVIAVTANVIVWAHHVYIDYPKGSPQAALNTVMEPLTFSVTIVSALSLYSLFFTMYRSRFDWNAASIALFFGLISWLLAGFSGIVNATIAFDQVIHNTLWIVGHFHHMAFLGIGLVIIGATYHWLPELLGKPLYSEAMARWHVSLTFFFAMANSVVWIEQGLLGAPRRFATLPDRYDTATQLGVPISIALGASQLLFAWNVVQTIRGRRRRERAWEGSARAIVVGIAAVFVACLGGWAAAHAGASGTPAAATTPTTTTGGGDAATAAGKRVFTSAGCTGCHTLADAGASGTVGPSLDDTKPDAATVKEVVTNGKGTTMPPYKGSLTATQIDDVAAYVSQAAGGG
jgi:cytochrome c oxidase subunit 1